MINTDLSRAFENFFRFKGGAQPTVPSEIVPVVIIDDNTVGPYPGHRRWMYGSGPTGIGSAGNFQYLGIQNADPLDRSQPSACVIDRLLVKNITAANDFAIGIAAGTGNVNIAYGGTRDTVGDKEASFAINVDPLFGNVKAGYGQSASLFGASLFPGSAVGLIVEIPGTWILGPQQQFFISSNVAQQSIHIFARGRYYPAL